MNKELRNAIRQLQGMYDFAIICRRTEMNPDLEIISVNIDALGKALDFMRKSLKIK